MADQITCMEAKNYAYLILAGTQEEKKPFVRPRPK